MLPPSAVVLLANEDGLSDTIRPRLEAAGADVSRVHHFDGVDVRDDDGQVVGVRPPTLPDDVGELEALVVATGARLVVVDVWNAYLSPRLDSYKDQQMRVALAPLGDMAARRGVLVLLLRHIPKSQRRAGQAIEAGSGSMGIVGVARAQLVVGIDPEDETGQRRVLAMGKSNLGPKPAARTYRIESDDDRGCGRIEWGGTTTHTADGLLRQLDVEQRSTLQDNWAWVEDVLLGTRDVLYKDLQSWAKDVGISRGQLDRIRQKHVADLEIETNKSAQGSPRTWRLSEEYFARTGFARTGPRETDTGRDEGEHDEGEGFARTLGERAKPNDVGSGRPSPAGEADVLDACGEAATRLTVVAP